VSVGISDPKKLDKAVMTQLTAAMTFDDGQIIGLCLLQCWDELSAFDICLAISTYKFERSCDKIYFKGLHCANFICTKFSLM